MPLVHSLLHITNFSSPLLHTIVPSVAAAVALQAAAAAPSIFFQTERFFDISGSLTFLAVGALSLYLPALRVRAGAEAAGASASPLPVLPSLLAPFGSRLGGAVMGGLDWRQVALTGAVTLWALRLGSYLFSRILNDGGKDARFEKIRGHPTRFAFTFFAQSLWVSLCLMPVITLNSVPATAFAAVSRFTLTDAVGLGVFVAGFACEIVADRQKSRWVREKHLKLHDEEFMTSGLFSRSQFPHYFGEMTLWAGLATASAGVLALRPIQLALGLSGGPAGILATTALSYISPAFSALILLKLSGVPFSEKKYDVQYGDRKDYQEWKKNTNKLVPRLW